MHLQGSYEQIGFGAQRSLCNFIRSFPKKTVRAVPHRLLYSTALDSSVAVVSAIP